MSICQSLWNKDAVLSHQQHHITKMDDIPRLHIAPCDTLMVDIAAIRTSLIHQLPCGIQWLQKSMALRNTGAVKIQLLCTGATDMYCACQGIAMKVQGVGTQLFGVKAHPLLLQCYDTMKARFDFLFL